MCNDSIVRVSVCRVETDTEMNRVYRNILRGYERDIRPAMNHSMPLNITFGFSLTQIIDVVSSAIDTELRGYSNSVDWRLPGDWRSHRREK